MATTNSSATAVPFVLGLYRPNTVSGRIVKLLSDGKPRTVKQVARAAKPKSIENILAPGGWYAHIRRDGKATGQFELAKTDDGKLVLKVAK
jgi:hypothetical protein